MLGNVDLKGKFIEYKFVFFEYCFYFINCFIIFIIFQCVGIIGIVCWVLVNWERYDVRFIEFWKSCIMEMFFMMKLYFCFFVGRELDNQNDVVDVLCLFLVYGWLVSLVIWLFFQQIYLRLVKENENVLMLKSWFFLFYI